MPTVLAIVQASMSSTRLPGKSLADVGGEPMLSLLLRRLQRSRKIDGIVVATSTDRRTTPSKARRARSVARSTVADRDDVLARFVAAADGHTGPLVRITGDCPLLDPAIVDEVIDLFLGTPSASMPATSSQDLSRRPRRGGRLARAPEKASQAGAEDPTRPRARDDVRSGVSLRRFPSARSSQQEDLGDLRWTVDTSEDLDFVRQVVARLGSRRHNAGMNEILAAITTEPSLAGYHGRRG